MRSHHMLRVSLLTLAALTLYACRTKKPLVSLAEPDPRWEVIDSFAGIGQYATALERTDALLEEAKTTSDWRTEFKT